MKKAVISIFFLGIVMLFGYVLIVYPTPIIDHVQHYGLFNYKMYSDIARGDILKIRGNVEKRLSSYQIIVNKIRRLNGDSYE